jgi:hypothetical protein
VLRLLAPQGHLTVARSRRLAAAFAILVATSASVFAEERTLWKPVHKSAFKEVSLTIPSSNSSEIASPADSAPSTITPRVLFAEPTIRGSTTFDESFENHYEGAPIGAIETTSDEFDYWMVDARKAPVEGDLRCGIRKLRYWHFAAGRWTEFCEGDFVAAMDPSLPTMFFVHGYGLGAPAAALSTVRYARKISRCTKKFRVVTWAWGSRHNWLETPWENVQDKSWKSEVQGYYLAHILGRICPDTHVALVGHSFGCRAVCASLQGLGSGTVCRTPLEGDPRPTNHPYEAMLIAAGIESCSLAPGNRYCLALSQVHRMTITTNPNDRVLNILALVTGNPDVMGLTGPGMGSIPLEEAAKVKVHGVGDYLWGTHRMGGYYWSSDTISAITPSLLYSDFLGVSSPSGGGSPFFSWPW